MTTFLEQVYGMEHQQKRLSLRLEKGKTDFAELTEALRSLTTNSADDISIETLSLSVGLTLFHRRNVQVEHGLMELCRAIAEHLPHVKELHINRSPAAGWQPLQVMTKFPVQAVEILLQKMSHLTALELTSLQLYSTEEESISSQEVLWNALEAVAYHQPKLKRFGWIYSDCIPRMNSVDPLLTTLSKIVTLQEVYVQTPSWASHTTTTEGGGGGGTSVEQLILGCPNLNHLRLKGPRLTPEQVQAISAAEQLQKLALAFPLEVMIIPTASSSSSTTTTTTHHPMGTGIAHLLQHSKQLKECSLSLRLEVNNHNHNNRTVVVPLDPPTIDLLQDVQDTIAHSLEHNTCLTHLEVLYHNHSTTPWEHPTQTNAFVDLLQHKNMTLSHLHLPFCGELETPVAFYQQLNQSGLRNALLRGRRRSRDMNMNNDNDHEGRENINENDATHFWNTLLAECCFSGSGNNGQQQCRLSKEQQHHKKNESVVEEDPKKTHQLSVLYYFLREKPHMISAAAAAVTTTTTTTAVC